MSFDEIDSVLVILEESILEATDAIFDEGETSLDIVLLIDGVGTTESCGI